MYHAMDYRSQRDTSCHTTVFPPPKRSHACQLYSVHIGALQRSVSFAPPQLAVFFIFRQDSPQFINYTICHCTKLRVWVFQETETFTLHTGILVCAIVRSILRCVLLAMVVHGSTWITMWVGYRVLNMRTAGRFSCDFASLCTDGGMIFCLSSMELS